MKKQILKQFIRFGTAITLCAAVLTVPHIPGVHEAESENSKSECNITVPDSENPSGIAPLHDIAVEKFEDE